ELLRTMVDAVDRLVGEAARPRGRSGLGSRGRPSPDEDLSSLASAVSSAVLALARRVDHLEWQVRRLTEERARHDRPDR
ncbi:MAG TPA: hypothetical protein VKR22_00320, partial [Acidimicrobiales bacterium]|nr:hypothetical protein [Acidimicrobiales bacterium]